MRFHHSAHYNKKRLLLFLLGFYIITAFSKLIQPTIVHREADLAYTIISHLPYICLVMILPTIVWILISERSGISKYIVFFAFIIPYTISDLITFWRMPSSFSSGDLVEIYVLIGAPFLFSKRFWYIVFFSLITRYIVVGVVLGTSIVLYPILILSILGLLSYMLLTFIIYVRMRVDESCYQLHLLREKLAHQERLEQLGHIATTISAQIRHVLIDLCTFATHKQCHSKQTREQMRSKIAGALQLLEDILASVRLHRVAQIQNAYDWHKVKKSEILFANEKTTTILLLIIVYVCAIVLFAMNGLYRPHLHLIYHLYEFSLSCISPYLYILFRRQKYMCINYILLFTLVLSNSLTTILLGADGFNICNHILFIIFILFSLFYLSSTYFMTVFLCTVYHLFLSYVYLKHDYLVAYFFFLLIIATITYLSLSQLMKDHRHLYRSISNQFELREQIELKEKSTAIGLFISGITHEIRNPLASISSYFELDDTADEYLLEELHIESVRLLGIVDTLASLERVDIGTSSDQRFCPESIIAQAIAIMKPFADERRVTMSISHLSVKPAIQVVGHDDLIKQSLINIIKNAIESTPPHGSVMIRLVTMKDAVVYEIHDTGCGMTQEELANITLPFYTTKENGTGLGLAISRHIIESHGGKLCIRSELGKGSTFAVSLPISY